MLIDWFTVAAQTLNFLILVWLLKRYLYQPILQAIDAREERIAAELSDASAKQTEAKNERELFQKKNETFDKERAALIEKAVKIADAEQQRLLEAAQKTAENLRIKHQQSIAKDAHNFKQTLSRKATHEVFSIARKALSDLATTSLEERMSDVFIRHLSKLDDTSKATLTQALKKTTVSAPALLRSTFELAEAQRLDIQYALNETFSLDIPLQFETAVDLISGIELSAGGQKLAWCIAEYLTALEQGVDSLLQEKAQQKKSSPKMTKKSVSAKPVIEAEKS